MSWVYSDTGATAEASSIGVKTPTDLLTRDDLIQRWHLGGRATRKATLVALRRRLSELRLVPSVGGGQNALYSVASVLRQEKRAEDGRAKYA